MATDDLTPVQIAALRDDMALRIVAALLGCRYSGSVELDNLRPEEINKMCALAYHIADRMLVKR